MGADKEKMAMSKSTKIVAILFVISVFILALYVGSSILVKASIKSNLQPIIEELQQVSDADSVDVRFFVEPESYAFPWAVEYHVYLTVNVSDLRRISDADALSILNNGVTLGQTEYSYTGKLDYAIYTRTVTDSITGMTHPVFVTLSDGNLNYSIERDRLYNVNQLYKEDAYGTLRPPRMSQTMLIFLLATVCSILILGALTYKRVVNAVNKGKSFILHRFQGKSRKKTIAVGVAFVVAVALVLMLVIAVIVVPTNKYNEAVSLLDTGNIEAAYEIFEELGNFKNCRDIRNEIDYFRVDELLTSHCWRDAYLLLHKLGDYKDSADMMEQLEAEKPYLSILLANCGDIVTFGEYEQDNDSSNGKEPIEWIVLYNEGGDVYLLSKYILDAQPFNTENTKECSLDDWLKTTFSENAFASIGDDVITRVGILQRIDIDNYNMTKSQITATYTQYAMSQNPKYGYASGLMWWIIKENLISSGGSVLAPVVCQDGSYKNYCCETTDRCGVRPAVWLFADPSTIPSEPVFDGSSPKQWRPSGNSGNNICSRCNGTGRVTKNFGNSWNDIPGYGYGDICGACGGTGHN